MSILELIIISISLSMDAFAVAICKGLSLKKIELKHMITVGLYFGFFQAIMPIIGYFLSIGFEHMIKDIDHWIAFSLLGIIGVNMIKDSFEDNKNIDKSFKFKAMLPLAVATSIDALAVGITIAFLNINIFISSFVIGIITFVMSILGTKIGNVFGAKYHNRAELVGGMILVIMGIKILLEHLGIF